MTDRRTTRRLSAAALLAPAAAALLAGSLAWADHNPPNVALQQAAATPAPTDDQADTELQERRRAVDKLRKQVAELRAELKDSAGGSSKSSSGSSASGTRATPRPAAKPAAKPKPTRTTKPPVDATTGAS